MGIPDIYDMLGQSVLSFADLVLEDLPKLKEVILGKEAFIFCIDSNHSTTSFIAVCEYVAHIVGVVLTTYDIYTIVVGYS